MPAKWAGLRCTEVDARGGTTTRYISFDKSELTTRYGLMPRDVRKLATSSNSHIRIRPSTVLLHIFHLKVLVQRDRVLVFDDATSVASRAAFVRELRERMRHRDTAHDAEAAAVRQASYGQQRLPFEFHALEAVLSFVVSELERELAAVHLSTELVLRSLEDDIDRRTLITLLSLSSKVVQFARQAELVRDAVEEVLDRDDRVAALYLTAKTAAGGGGKTAADDLTVAERLLGSYYIAYNGIVHDAQNLVSGIRNTQERSDFCAPHSPPLADVYFFVFARQRQRDARFQPQHHDATGPQVPHRHARARDRLAVQRLLCHEHLQLHQGVHGRLPGRVGDLGDARRRASLLRFGTSAKAGARQDDDGPRGNDRGCAEKQLGVEV